jgi:hypothetical protein
MLGAARSIAMAWDGLTMRYINAIYTTHQGELVSTSSTRISLKRWRRLR